MVLFNEDIKTLDDLFVHTLEDIYYAEHKITKALPDMIARATDPQLKQGFEKHLGETRNQVQRLERVFQMHGREPQAVTCPAIDGIISEAEDVAADTPDKQVLDAALVASAQAVEHYEITRYGSLVAWARQLGRDDCAQVLEETLAEEKAADQALTQVAESHLNARAASSQGSTSSSATGDGHSRGNNGNGAGLSPYLRGERPVAAEMRQCSMAAREDAGAGLASSLSTKLAENMEVLGADGQHVGVIDHIEGASIELKKDDPAAHGRHHFIPLDWVVSVDRAARLNLSAADAWNRWTAA